jgi:hypothetical protein
MAVATTNSSATLESRIVAFMHCADCLAEKPDGISPKDWARLSVGYTSTGMQVWCVRHEINIVHVEWAKA